MPHGISLLSRRRNQDRSVAQPSFVPPANLTVYEAGWGDAFRIAKLIVETTDSNPKNKPRRDEIADALQRTLHRNWENDRAWLATEGRNPEDLRGVVCFHRNENGIWTLEGQHVRTPARLVGEAAIQAYREELFGILRTAGEIALRSTAEASLAERPATILSPQLSAT